MFSKFNRNISCHDLRLDRSCIFISAGQHSEPDSSITGTFLFSLSQAALIKSIKVRVQGILKIPRDEFLISNDREQLTFERSIPLATSKTLSSFPLPAGSYEFPFEIHLGSAAAETVTGPNHEYHSYKVQGVIERRFGNKLVVSRPIRVYKLFELEANHSWPSSPESIENQWDENIHYNISIPDRNIPFGSTFPVEFWLAPLSKDVKLVAVTIQVLERHDLKIVATAAESVRSNIHFLNSRKSHVVFSERHDFTVENHETPNLELLDVGWRIAKPVRLPQTLDACSQTVRSDIVKIDHVLTTTIELRNPGGCISTITKSFPFNIFMSPNVVGEDSAVHGQDIQQFQRNKIPPPPYGAHVSDSTIFESSEVSGNNGCGHRMVAGVNIGRLPHEQAYGCEVLECVPSYETAVCMMINGS